MTIKELIQNGVEKLKQYQFENEIFIAKQLLIKLLNKTNQYILINQDEILNDKICNEFNKNIDEIIQGKPLQYITNNQAFMGYDFFVNESVLIPQPDTEIVVQKCIEIYNNLASNNKVKILDLCTGSGAIAISVDKILNKEDNIEVYASDISMEALKVANKNQKILNSKVNFIQSNMFENIEGKFDIIVSNPPYIKTSVIEHLPKDVQEEPHLALDGGEDGLKFYRTIEQESIKYLRDKGYLCMEIGYDQAISVKEILEEKYENIEVIKDFSGNDRCIVARAVGR